MTQFTPLVEQLHRATDAEIAHGLRYLGRTTGVGAELCLGGRDVRMHHADDTFVDTFAAAMKAKLADARAKGRGGWDDPERCDVRYLADLLLEQVQKPDADPVDVANFAMFLHHRAGGIEALRASIAQAQGYTAT
jgi:hypothetical protein